MSQQNTTMSDKLKGQKFSASELNNLNQTINNNADDAEQRLANVEGKIFGRVGFVDYNDTATSVTPVTLPADTWVDIPNDGLGAFTNTTYAPNGVTNILTPEGYIDCSEFDLGDLILIRADFTVFPTINNALVHFRYGLGGNPNEYELPKLGVRLDDGAGEPYRQAVAADFVYMGDTNTNDNTVRLQAKLSSGGTLVNAGMAIGIIKR